MCALVLHFCMIMSCVIRVMCPLVSFVTGSRTVIHPKARIIAEDGPIIIGENNIIEELVQIINRLARNRCSVETQVSQKQVFYRNTG